MCWDMSKAHSSLSIQCSCTLGGMLVHLTKMTMPNKDDIFLARNVQYWTAVFKFYQATLQLVKRTVSFYKRDLCDRQRGVFFLIQKIWLHSEKLWNTLIKYSTISLWLPALTKELQKANGMLFSEDFQEFKIPPAVYSEWERSFMFSTPYSPCAWLVAKVLATWSNFSCTLSPLFWLVFSLTAEHVAGTPCIFSASLFPET